MNEEKVEYMKAQHVLRQNQFLLNTKPSLRVVRAQSRKIGAVATLGAALMRLFASIRANARRSDLDLESWQRIELRGKHEEPRDPRRLDQHRYFS